MNRVSKRAYGRTFLVLHKSVTTNNKNLIDPRIQSKVIDLPLALPGPSASGRVNAVLALKKSVNMFI